MLSTMPNEFISKSISSRVDIMKDDDAKRKGYGTNLAENSEKNNLHYAIGSVGINELGILSSHIYTNVNKLKQNPYLKLISAIHNLLNNDIAKDHNDKPKPVINYNLDSDRKPLNDWDNPNFFPIAFPALFPYRDGGHIIL